MNQRIRELADEAGLRFTQLMSNPMVPVVDGKETDFEKFAELIVRECIRVPYDMWDKAELNADIAVKIEHRIKDHFGVEE
jgi:hypothetical protein